ncbi:(Fe-S)-binding protein [Streptomyces inhibens]|uniref:(Fe-S)-binding protein n=1 Tax=Streptomyces inhibens TaxID=2293571 RepID=UPI00402AA1CC
MRIALFITCFNDTLYPQTGRAVVRLLERLGHTVEFPRAQACCGQMHFNTGYRPEALPMARRFAEVFAGYERVVTPSGSCAGMIWEHHRTIAGQYGDAKLRAAVETVAPRVHELSELLVDVLDVTDVGAYFPHRVTYQADGCCGFGGTFALKNPDVSTAMLADKVHCVRSTGAEVLTAGDNSCLMQISGSLNRLRTGIGSMHLAEQTRHHRRRRTISGTTADGLVRLGTPSFPEAARTAVADGRLRANLRGATRTIRGPRPQ